jgi:hypothetical protein
MSPRLPLLVGLLAAVPGWSQEAPTFDLGSTAIKQIVRKTAATQFGETPASVTPVAEPGDDPTLEPIPVATWVPEKAPMPRPAKPPPPPDGPISALVHMLIDEALGVDHSIDVTTPHDDWLRCPARAEDMAGTDVTDACPGRQSAWGLTEPLGYQSPEIRAR